jgi:hypothetical protein
MEGNTKAAKTLHQPIGIARGDIFTQHKQGYRPVYRARVEESQPKPPGHFPPDAALAGTGGAVQHDNGFSYAGRHQRA